MIKESGVYFNAIKEVEYTREKELCLAQVFKKRRIYSISAGIVLRKEQPHNCMPREEEGNADVQIPLYQLPADGFHFVFEVGHFLRQER